MLRTVASDTSAISRRRAARSTTTSGAIDLTDLASDDDGAAAARPAAIDRLAGLLERQNDAQRERECLTAVNGRSGTHERGGCHRSIARDGLRRLLRLLAPRTAFSSLTPCVASPDQTSLRQSMLKQRPKRRSRASKHTVRALRPPGPYVIAHAHDGRSETSQHLAMVPAHKHRILTSTAS